jgi:predicted GIY-YIG superfamily endonuclease
MGYWVYVLSCSQNKWYVGATSKKPELRFKEHLNDKRASAWCKRYKPEYLAQATKYSNKLEMLVYEKLTTFEFMKKMGYEQVRGSNFCQLKPIDLKQLSWDMAHLTGDDANVLIKTLSPNGPLSHKYGNLCAPKVKSKYFI